MKPPLKQPVPTARTLTVSAIGLHSPAPAPGDYTANMRTYQTGIPPGRVVLETERGYRVEDGDLVIEIPSGNIAWINR